VRGGGLAQLRRRGVSVEEGVLEDECREQHRGFLSNVTRGRPFLTLKLATTLDARIATAAGESRWITGPEARAHVHRLRDRCDAILVGSGTAFHDDPALTARREASGSGSVRRPGKRHGNPRRGPPAADAAAKSCARRPR
jgi:diaminohydroxyphosphoribosylaminopyrimidine deaminase/5-amino-6-(5-phosphoribosylamino)uracil reductase